MKSCTDQLSECLSVPVPSPLCFSNIVSYHKHCIDYAKMAQNYVMIKFFPKKSRNHGVTCFSSANKHTSKARKSNGIAEHGNPFCVSYNETSNDASIVEASHLGMTTKNTTQNRKRNNAEISSYHIHPIDDNDVFDNSALCVEV